MSKFDWAVGVMSAALVTEMLRLLDASQQEAAC